jgi:hypothetical protein
MAEAFEIRISAVFNTRDGKPAAKGVDISNPKREVFINLRDSWMGKKKVKPGAMLQVLAVPPADARHRAWVVVDIPIQRQPGVTFEDWQTQERLPETTINDPIRSISIGCAGCGATLLHPCDILKFKGGCIWTRGELHFQFWSPSHWH